MKYKINFKRSVDFAIADRQAKAKDIAKELGISGSYFSALRHGKKKLSIKRLEQTASALNYKVSEFIALGEWDDNN